MPGGIFHPGILISSENSEHFIQLQPMLRLVCPDGDVIIPKRDDILAKMELFKRRPELADARSYELDCRASVKSVNLLLGRLYDESEKVAITEDNFSELRSLCRELGFSGLDKELDSYESDSTIRPRRQFTCPARSINPIFDGIISYLTRECGGNVHDKGIVNITSSSVNSECTEPRHVADLLAESWFQPKHEPGGWICYDFKERRVIPTSFTVQWTDGLYPNHFSLEVSNDQESWTEVHHVTGYVTVDFKHTIHPWDAVDNIQVSNVPSEGFRFIRLRVSEQNCPGAWDFGLAALEIFGTLFEK